MSHLHIQAALYVGLIAWAVLSFVVERQIARDS